MPTRATRGTDPVDVRVPELYDHAVVMVVNVFMDKLSRAAPWAIETRDASWRCRGSAIPCLGPPGLDSRRDLDAHTCLNVSPAAPEAIQASTKTLLTKVGPTLKFGILKRSDRRGE
jgi:hypothetical protein